MSFVHLPEDVVLHALSICDVSSVISFSETNKYLHHIAFTPTVWMSLVEDLRLRGFVDRLSTADIRSMSTESLVAVVKRVVLGPEAWSPPPRIQSPKTSSLSRMLGKLATPRQSAPLGSGPPPTRANKHIVVHPSIPPGRALCTDFKVLPGGKYVLFHTVNESHFDLLGCWRVSDDSLLGTYHCDSGPPSAVISDFAAEVLPGGERANIALCMSSMLLLHVHSIVIVSWDFVTGTTELLSVIEYPAPQLHGGSLPNICGDIAAVRDYHDESSWADSYILIDWRTQKYCKIQYPINIGLIFSMKIIPGYFILAIAPSSRPTVQIVVCAIASLSDYWAPVTQYNTGEPVLISNIPHVALTTIQLKTAKFWPVVTLEAHESPLEWGIYRVWLYIKYTESRLLSGSTDHALLCRFRISVPGPGGRQFTWQQQSCSPADTNERHGGISYSGHTPADFRSLVSLNHQILPPKLPPAPIIIAAPEGVMAARQVAPYSGGLAYATPMDNTLVLSYFE
ncbi:hypothetical protein C8R44DRAFT_772028 [Mycena epipterygia]|nr:hypothetical protein C8R44DRAFT_772028 [Mycena epipterygia]